MGSLEAQEIIDLLGPRSTVPEILWDISLYLIFFFAIITMFLQSDKTILPGFIMVTVALLAVIDKLQIFDERDIGTFVIHIIMFVGPTLVAGITRVTSSRAPAVFGALIGVLYAFAFWFFVQR